MRETLINIREAYNEWAIRVWLTASKVITVIRSTTSAILVALIVLIIVLQALLQLQ